MEYGGIEFVELGEMVTVPIPEDVKGLVVWLMLHPLVRLTHPTDEARSGVRQFAGVSDGFLMFSDHGSWPALTKVPLPGHGCGMPISYAFMPNGFAVSVGNNPLAEPYRLRYYYCDEHGEDIEPLRCQAQDGLHCALGEECPRDAWANCPLPRAQGEVRRDIGTSR